jgi:hypothetical protein
MRFSGIHRSEFFGYPATGKPVEWAGCALFTFKEGKVADLWHFATTLPKLFEAIGRKTNLDRNAESVIAWIPTSDDR